MRNPDWNRDELILAMDLYFRSGRRQLDANHPDVLALSSVLNSLGVHDSQARGAAFRNPNGVAMKMGNFSAIDPQASGAGLPRGNRLEGEVWKEYAHDLPRLRTTAAAILQLATPQSIAEPIRGWDPDGLEEEFPEGRLLTRLHIARERNPIAVRKKKAAVLKTTGKLQCECCGFDFAQTYGTLGEAFAECHHRMPLSALKEGTQTRLRDLAIVCANCHRMLHRSGNTLSVEDLHALIKTRQI